MFLAPLLLLILPAFAQPSAPASIPVTLLHTNDLHSHFRPEKTPLALGGVARLKTAVQKIRAAVPHSLLVDGGDWSEGNIYYNEGAGRETLRMMDHLSYDVAVVGNHDWINGPDHLLRILDEANPSMKLVASNLDASPYPRAEEFRRKIPPYVIREIGGAKIAFIGLLTYEWVYDKYMKPLKISAPFLLTRELAHQLKKQADVVIVLSHNSIKMNRAILAAAPEVDLIIGAHDHVKLTQPIIVDRLGAQAGWIVEAGSWGRYLGQVDLEVTPRDPSRSDSSPSVTLKNYQLHQMDASIPEDAETLSQLATLEALIESKKGPIFHDHVGHCEIELGRRGMENLMGDFTTDAYRRALNADLAIDHTNFIYSEIPQGDVTTADVFNSNPGVYNPQTDKAWTLRLLPIKGHALSALLNLFYSFKALTQRGTLNFSGAEVIFSPILSPQKASPLSQEEPALVGVFAEPPSQQGLVIRDFKIAGQKIEKDRTYRLAAPGGVVESLEFLNSMIPNAVPLDQMQDSGQEGWRVMADYLRAMSPLTMDKIPYGTRVRTLQPDLGLVSSDVRWEPLYRDSQGQWVANIHVRIRNTGTQNSAPGTLIDGPSVGLFLNNHGVNYSIDESFRSVGDPLSIPALAPGETHDFFWENIPIPETLGVYGLTVQIRGNDGEINHTNDSITRHFKL